MPEGALAAGSCMGRLRMGADLSDYAFTALGALEYYAAAYDTGALALAKKLCDGVLEHFSSENGGFYSTADSAERLLFRPEEHFDGAVPSGSSAMAAVLDMLFRLTGDVRYAEALDALTRRLCSLSGAYPAGCCFALTGLMGRIFPTREIVCVSPDGSVPPALDAVTGRYDVLSAVMLKTPENADALAALAPFTADMCARDGKPTLYVCEGGSCSQPITV